jgi:hypothetical protein
MNPTLLLDTQIDLMLHGLQRSAQPDAMARRATT